MNTMEKVARCGIVPVIVINDAAQAVPLAKALLAGGINVIEITFRTAAAREAIAAVAREVPDMIVGAGTVLTEEQVASAVAAGARFLVSPGMDADVIKAAQALNCPILPGVVTPSEVITGLKLGIKTFKFFPAENYGGLSTIKSLCAPFTAINFIPTGGINEKNVADYLKYDRIAAIGGSWMAPAKLIDSGRFDEIEAKTKEAVALLRSIRP